MKIEYLNRFFLHYTPICIPQLYIVNLITQERHLNLIFFSLKILSIIYLFLIFKCICWYEFCSGRILFGTNVAFHKFLLSPFFFLMNSFRVPNSAFECTVVCRGILNNFGNFIYEQFCFLLSSNLFFKNTVLFSYNRL